VERKRALPRCEHAPYSAEPRIPLRTSLPSVVERREIRQRRQRL